MLLIDLLLALKNILVLSSVYLLSASIVDAAFHLLV